MNTASKTTLEESLELVSALRERNTSLEKKIQHLEDRIAWLVRQVYGQRSERVVEPDPNELFLPGLEPGSEDESSDPGETEEVPAHQRKKRKPKNDYSNGLLIPEDLPVEQEILDLSEEEKVCSETGLEMVKVGDEISRKLVFRSAHYIVKETIRPKYAVPGREEAGIATQELPSSILPRSKADESLLAEIVTSKFADHLPLYRLSERLSRDGVQISRQLLSQWLIGLGSKLTPLYDLMLKEIKESGNVFIDETPVKMQVKGKGKLQQGYMWTLVGGEGSDPPLRIYRFFDNRKHQNAYDLLNGYAGSVHSDKYGAYEKLAKQTGIVWNPCWAHIRRKFEEAKSGDPEFRKWILRKIRHLFLLERVAWNRSPEERLKIRQEKEQPIIDLISEKVKEKISSGDVLPKSGLGKALFYYNGLSPSLKNYLQSPNARLDNNVAERAIRPLALGRKNWLFVGSMKGGQATSVLLSLVQTCRGLEINPREYLEDVMRRFQDHPVNRLSELLPHNWMKEQNKLRKARKTKPLHQR